uniref:SH2 domain-containing protein n=1 Tax=Sphaeramia orbicularis TaxID=375764 RepID=A0A673ARY9_9TELE
RLSHPHLLIGSEATEMLLERFGRDGSFLLRDSDTVRGAYCLCVRWVKMDTFCRKFTCKELNSNQPTDLKCLITLKPLIESIRVNDSDKM